MRFGGGCLDRGGGLLHPDFPYVVTLFADVDTPCGMLHTHALQIVVFYGSGSIVHHTVDTGGAVDGQGAGRALVAIGIHHVVGYGTGIVYLHGHDAVAETGEAVPVIPRCLADRLRIVRIRAGALDVEQIVCAGINGQLKPAVILVNIYHVTLILVAVDRHHRSIKQCADIQELAPFCISLVGFETFFGDIQLTSILYIVAKSI